MRDATRFGGESRSEPVIIGGGPAFRLSRKSKTTLRLSRDGHLVVDIATGHKWAVLRCAVPQPNLLAVLRAINRRRTPAATAGIQDLTLLATRDVGGATRLRLRYLSTDEPSQARRCSLPVPRGGRATGVRPLGPSPEEWGLTVEGLIHKAVMTDGNAKARSRDHSSYLAGLAARRAWRGRRPLSR